MIPTRTVLNPTDFSESAYHAYRNACMLARSRGARLIVLHIAEPRVAAQTVAHTEQCYAPSARAREADQASLERRMRDEFGRDPTIHTETRLEHEDPVEAILHLTANTGLSLIVAGAYGPGGPGRSIVGSIAEAVLRQDRRPVLIVMSPDVAPFTAPDVPAFQAWHACGRDKQETDVHGTDLPTMKSPATGPLVSRPRNRA